MDLFYYTRIILSVGWLEDFWPIAKIIGLWALGLAMFMF